MEDGNRCEEKGLTALDVGEERDPAVRGRPGSAEAVSDLFLQLPLASILLATVGCEPNRHVREQDDAAGNRTLPAEHHVFFYRLVSRSWMRIRDLFAVCKPKTRLTLQTGG